MVVSRSVRETNLLRDLGETYKDPSRVIHDVLRSEISKYPFRTRLNASPGLGHGTFCIYIGALFSG
jgi:hypothetical protein